jgi:hypothetical protein
MKSENREGLWAHDKTGDIKGNPSTSPGLNILPDGNVALTRSWIEDAYKLSQEAQEK